MGVQVSLVSSTLNIVNVYSRTGAITADLNTYCRQLQGPTLILGDFNLHHPLWGAPAASRLSEAFVDWLNTSSYCLINSTQNTHISPSGVCSLIDLSLCSPDLLARIVCNVVDDPHGSDHFPIQLLIDGPEMFSPQRLHYRWPDVCHEVNKALSTMSQLNYSTFNQTVQLAMSNNVRKRVPLKSTFPAWWSLRCKALLAQKKFYLKKAIQLTSTDFWIKYKKTSARLRKAILEAKRDFWDRTCQDARDPKLLFKTFNKIKNRSCSSPDSHLCFTSDGTRIFDASTQSKILARMFSGDQGHEPIPLTYGTDADAELNAPFSKLELSDAIQRTKSTTPGEDRIPASFYKGLNDHSLDLLLEMYNSIWVSGDIPPDWTSAVILPILKPNKPRKDPTSYRPIALTSVACKICERMIVKRLNNYLLKHHILDHRHLGFLPFRDSHTALTMLHHDILQAKKEKKFILGVSLDIQAAYDSIYIDGLLQKCAQMGITGVVLRWIHKFLTNRRIKVAWRNLFSPAYSTYQGVPQGAVLSPILFTIFMADLFEALGVGIRCLVYADDIFLYIVGDTLSYCRSKLQDALRHIYHWCTYWKLSIRPDKCHSINLSRRRSDCDFQFYIHNGLIEWVDEIKFLGFYVARRGGLKRHVDYIRRKAFQRINILKALAHRRYGARSHHLLTLMNASIRCLVDYGASVLSTACDTLLKTLEVYQNSGLRVALGLPQWVPLLVLRQHAGLPPLSDRLRELAIRFWIKHLSLGQWSPLTIHMETSGTMLSQVPILADFFAGARCSPEHILPFQFPVTLPEDVIHYHLSGLPFQSTTLNSSMVSTYFAEFISDYHSEYEIIATDASKSLHITAIAGCSHSTQFGYRLHDVNSIFTAEALAIGTAIDELAWMGRSFVLLTDSLSVLTAVQATTPSSPSVILWLHQKIFRASTLTSSIHLVWVPGHRGIPLNEKADFIAKSIGHTDVLLDWVSPDDLTSHCRRQTMEVATQQYSQSKYLASHGEIPSIKRTSTWGQSRREDVLISRLLCKMLLTPALLFRFHLASDGTCSYCHVPDSLDHILFFCNRYQRQRRVCFDARIHGPGAQLRSFPSFVQSMCTSSDFRTMVMNYLHSIDRF